MTKLWKSLKPPPVNTMKSPSGIPQAPIPVCFSVNVPPPRIKKHEFVFVSFTWHDLCTEGFCKATVAEQYNGVGSRESGIGRRPSRVISSRHAVIVFYKGGDSDGLLFVEVLSFTNIESETNANNNLMMRREGLSIVIGRHLIV